MFSRTFGFTYSGADSINKRAIVTGGGEANLDEAVASGATNLSIPTFKLDVSQVKGILLHADQAMTVKTNSSGSPVNTFTLAAGVPFLWLPGGDVFRDTAGTAVSTDVTGLFVTNAGETDGTLQVRCVFDPTP